MLCVMVGSCKMLMMIIIYKLMLLNFSNEFYLKVEDVVIYNVDNVYVV